MLGINWLDFVLLVLLGIGVAIGYVQGLLRQVIGLAALYLGAILASQYFYVLARALKGIFTTTPGTLINAAAFFIIMFATLIIISFLAYDAYSMTHLHLFPWLDRIGGMVIGLVSAWVLVTLVVNVLLFATSITSWSEAEGARQILQQGLQASTLSVATSFSFPVILGTIKPWLPAGMPAIFNL